MSLQTTLSTQMHTPSQERSFVFARLGFWSAVLTAVFSVLFVVGSTLGTAGLLLPPWDVVIAVGASLLAPSFVVMMMSVHYAAPAEKKIWSQIGMTFAVLYAALVSIEGV